MNLKIVLGLFVIIVCFTSVGVSREAIEDPDNKKKRPLFEPTCRERKRPTGLVIQRPALSIETTSLPGGPPIPKIKKATCVPAGSPIPRINKVTCAPAGSPIVSRKPTLSVNTACLLGGSLIPPEKNHIHRIYDDYPEHVLVVAARKLEIPMLSIVPKDASLYDLSNSILPFLNQLEFLRLEPSAITITRTIGTGTYNSGIYLVSQGGQSIYVVKIHHPYKTSSNTRWSLHGVATWNDSQKEKYKPYPHLPRLCCDVAIGAFKLSVDQFHFSVMHAAQGESVSDILKRKGKESNADKIKILAAVGKSLGCFHAYHALHNDYLRERFENYMKLNYMKVEGESFYTINHMDLHPGNIFVDDLGNVTFVDLEGMFSAVISPRENLVDWNKLHKHVRDLSKEEGEKSVSILDQHYCKGLSETWKTYKELNSVTAVFGSSTAETEGDS